MFRGVVAEPGYGHFSKCRPKFSTEPHRVQKSWIVHEDTRIEVRAQFSVSTEGTVDALVGLEGQLAEMLDEHDIAIDLVHL
jgi:hypothetical protein